MRKNFDKTVEDNGERFRFIIEDGNCFVVSSKGYLVQKLTEENLMRICEGSNIRKNLLKEFEDNGVKIELFSPDYELEDKDSLLSCIDTNISFECYQKGNKKVFESICGAFGPSYCERVSVENSSAEIADKLLTSVLVGRIGCGYTDALENSEFIRKEVKKIDKELNKEDIREM